MEEGRQKFRNDIEQLFGRNGIAFTLSDGMKIQRLGPPEARPMLATFVSNTGDGELDNKLRDVHCGFYLRSLRIALTR
jgi:hypothetical protein